MQLPSEHVTPVGLIAVELVTNSLKYGTGPVAVQVRRTEQGVDILVEDSGPGFPADFSPGAGSSLGMRLVAALARRRDAVAISRSANTTLVTVHVTFAENGRQP